MPFRGLLENLVSRVPGALAAVMSAYDGEPVVEVLSPVNQKMDRFHVQLLGAQMRSAMTQVCALHGRLRLAPAEFLSVRGQGISFYVYFLRDDYFLLLAVEGVNPFQSEVHLREIAKQVIHEM